MSVAGSGNTWVFAVFVLMVESFHPFRRTLIRPLPVRDVWSIHAEFISVVFACDLLVAQGLANAGPRDAETGHPVDGVNGQAEPVGLVANGQLQRRVDVALLLVTAHMDVALAGPAVREPVDQPRIGVEVEDHRLVRSEEGLELTICEPVWVF